MKRGAFLTHFVICLTASGAAVLATIAGVPQGIFAADASRMTSVIAGLAVFMAAYLGLKAWQTDDAASWRFGAARARFYPTMPDASLGHLAEKLAVMVGMLGTVIGLSLQLKATHGSVDSLAAFSTQFSSTGCGIVAAIVIALMTHNVEAAARRVQQ
jgi:hypothetical protein